MNLPLEPTPVEIDPMHWYMVEPSGIVIFHDLWKDEFRIVTDPEVKERITALARLNS